jgi:hypothetical protein
MRVVATRRPSQGCVASDSQNTHMPRSNIEQVHAHLPALSGSETSALERQDHVRGSVRKQKGTDVRERVVVEAS